ncbi:hypothetical protein TIFTF001_044060, partial [Ficus carica]
MDKAGVSCDKKWRVGSEDLLRYGIYCSDPGARSTVSSEHMACFGENEERGQPMILFLADVGLFGRFSRKRALNTAERGQKWQWLVVNSKGRAYTQRVEPKLALVEVELPKDAFLLRILEPTTNSFLVVESAKDKLYGLVLDTVIKAPGMDVLKVSLSAPREVANGVSVWEWSGSALDEGDEASKWFSNYLGKPSRLVRFNA